MKIENSLDAYSRYNRVFELRHLQKDGDETDVLVQVRTARLDHASNVLHRIDDIADYQLDILVRKDMIF